MEHTLSIKNNQGLSLSAVFHYPGKTIRYPAVILLHGFHGSKEEEHISSLAIELQKKNIAAIRFDMSGLGESEGSLEEDYRLSNHLSDIDSIFSVLCSQFFIDEHAIGIAGHSMGGLAALLYAAKNNAIRSICAISPLAHPAEGAHFKGKMKSWKDTGWLEEQTSRFGILNFPYEYIEDVMRHDIRAVSESITQPKLVIWGGKDKTVLPSESEEVYDFLHQPKESLVIPDLDHYYKRNPEQLNVVNKKIVSFFSETL